MPELPEVNTFQNYFNQHALNRPIKKVKVSDAKIIRNVSAQKFRNRLTGRTFTGSYRRGKFMFGALDNGHHVLFHFGMTGDLKYYEAVNEAPRHERFHFEFKQKGKLGFDCPRKFARILYLDDLEDYIKESKLGLDALEISKEEFINKAQGKKVSIKGFLLNQHILAGVGNLYADAICFDTKIHPASKTGALTKSQLTRIHKRMQDMLSEAIQRLANYKSYPTPWYWDWRREGNKPKKNAGLVKVIKVAGRTTYYCEGWQKRFG